MGKNRDIIQILAFILIGMFIPFLGSILITFGLNLSNTDHLLKIGSAFGHFLLIFGIEFGIIYLYFKISGKIASKKIDNYKPK